MADENEKTEDAAGETPDETAATASESDQTAGADSATNTTPVQKAEKSAPTANHSSAVTANTAPQSPVAATPRPRPIANRQTGKNLGWLLAYLLILAVVVAIALVIHQDRGSASPPICGGLFEDTSDCVHPCEDLNTYDAEASGYVECCKDNRGQWQACSHPCERLGDDQCCQNSRGNWHACNHPCEELDGYQSPCCRDNRGEWRACDPGCGLTTIDQCCVDDSGTTWGFCDWCESTRAGTWCDPYCYSDDKGLFDAEDEFTNRRRC